MNIELNNRSSAARRRARAQRGSSVVEFALVLPIFALLLVGTLDMGRGYFITHVLLDSAQAGARVGSLPSTSTSDVSVAVHKVLDVGDSHYAQSATIVTSNIGTNGTQGSVTSVAVTVPFTALAGTLIPGWSGTLNLTQTAKVRHE